MRANNWFFKIVLKVLFFALCLPMISTIEIACLYNSMPSGIYTHYPNVTIEKGTILSETKAIHVPWGSHVPSNQLLIQAISKEV